MPFWMRFAYKHFVNILIKRLSLATLDFWISILLSNLQFIRHIKARFYLNSAKNVLEVSILGFLYQRLFLQKKRLKMFLFKKAWIVLANKTSFLLKVNNSIIPSKYFCFEVIFNLSCSRNELDEKDFNASNCNLM